jgi:hypothetical protein
MATSDTGVETGLETGLETGAAKVALGSKDKDRLSASVRFAYEQLSIFREKRALGVREFAGKHYSKGGTSDRQPVNLLKLAVLIYQRHLAAHNPKVLVRAHNPALMAAGIDLALAVNHILGRMRFERTLRRCVFEGMFGLTVAKVGLAESGIVEIDGEEHVYREPFVDVVDLDDWVHDTDAKTWEGQSFRGSRVSVSLESLRRAKLYNEDVLNELESESERQTLPDGGKRARDISQDQRDPDPFRKRVEIWELFLPFDGLMVSMTTGPSPRVIRTCEWNGPTHGPFHALRFMDVPGQVMPLCPVSDWIDGSMAANRIAVKLIRQAERQKEVGLVRPGGEEDAQRDIASKDGEFIRSDDPKSVTIAKFGGVDQANLAFLIQLKDMFSFLGGNLDTLGGLAPMADTLGQERLMVGSSAKGVQDWQAQFVSFTREIVRDIALYLWEDPLVDLPLTKRIEGTSIDIPVRWNQESKSGEFLDYNFDIDPYSMQGTDPSGKLGTLLSVFQQVIVPGMPMLASAGFAFDLPKMISLVAQCANLPELDGLLVPMTPAAQQMMQQMSSEGSAPIGNTKRTYERVNRGGATRQGKDMALTQALSGGIQPKEADMALRPVG